MPVGVVLFIAWMALELVVVIGFIVWGIEQGHWKNIEGPKYTMLEDHEIAPWPGREPANPGTQQADMPAKE